MSEMTYTEVCERYTESLKKMSDRLREMARTTGNATWDGMAASIDGIRHKGETVMVAKALSVKDRDESLDRFKTTMISH